MSPTRRFEFSPSEDHFSNNVPSSDSREPQTLQEIVKNLGVIGLLAVLAGCSRAPEPETSTGLLPAAPAPAEGCGEDGYLKTSLYGALESDINWSGDALDCEGMQRPDNAGARLRFAGQMGDKQLAVIIAIPTLVRGEGGRELPSNVTLIEEGDGRFFSTAGNESCWTDILVQEPVGAGVHKVEGTLYCIAPIIEVNGEASVSVSDLNFSGLIDWGDA